MHGYVYFHDVPRSRDGLARVSLNQAGILLSCVHTGPRELGVKVGIKGVRRGQGAREEGETNKTDWLGYGALRYFKEGTALSSPWFRAPRLALLPPGRELACHQEQPGGHDRLEPHRPACWCLYLPHPQRARPCSVSSYRSQTGPCSAYFVSINLLCFVNS